MRVSSYSEPFIIVYKIHGARELEEVMDKNLAESRFNRTRTGRLRKSKVL